MCCFLCNAHTSISTRGQVFYAKLCSDKNLSQNGAKSVHPNIYEKSKNDLVVVCVSGSNLKISACGGLIW